MIPQISHTLGHAKILKPEITFLWCRVQKCHNSRCIPMAPPQAQHSSYAHWCSQIEHSGTIATWLWEHLVCKQATWFTQACSCEKPVQCPKNWTISQPFLGFFLSLAPLALGSAFRLGVDFVKSPRLDTASFKDVRLASTEASSAWANASHRVKVEIDMQPIPHPKLFGGLFMTCAMATNTVLMLVVSIVWIGLLVINFFDAESWVMTRKHFISPCHRDWWRWCLAIMISGLYSVTNIVPYQSWFVLWKLGPGDDDQ